MALFQSDLKDAIKKLSNKEFGSIEERDQLLAQVTSADNLKARDVIWMMFRPDRAIRDGCGAWMKQRATPSSARW